MTIVLFVLIFGVIVIGHELGHFLLAKVNGITVVEFSVGMGPKLLHFNKGLRRRALSPMPVSGQEFPLCLQDPFSTSSWLISWP